MQPICDAHRVRTLLLLIIANIANISHHQQRASFCKGKTNAVSIVTHLFPLGENEETFPQYLDIFYKEKHI